MSIINLTDLRYSNTVYIIRTVAKNPKTVEEIAKETELSILAVNKIVKVLVEKKILIKTKSEEIKMGRPTLYVSLNPDLFSALITKEKGCFVVRYVSVLGKVSDIFAQYANTFLSESNTLRLVKGRIGSTNENLLNIYYVDENEQEIEEIKSIQNYHPIDLIVDAIKDEEKVVYFEYDNAKVLINHNKPKQVGADHKVLSKIVDIDEIYSFTSENKIDGLAYAVKLLSIKQLEKII